MNFKQKITFISSVFLVAACSDDSTTSPSKENTQSQQYQCADGSIVDDLALCAIVDNGVIGEEVTIRYTCQDGSVVTDVNLCNSGATDSIEVSTYTCSNGLIVLDPSQCPQIITCLDGKVVASLEECAQEIEAPSSSSQNEESPTSSTTVTDTPTSSTPTVDIPMSSTPVVDTPASSSQTTPVANPDVSNGNTPSITYTASGANLSNDNGCVTVNGGEVVITCGGDYDFSGSYK
ncbi:MAG: hypothetical protein HUK21_10755, partial [Fibrobacteraceae bacterium]|nr:hypothetical protein [Fibrobacteraceae bacterium]